MQITKEKNGTELTVTLEGSLDTLTSRDLEAALRNSMDDIDKLIIDMKKLDYVSSAGLRVLFKAYKVMTQKGSMTLRNLSQEVMDVIEVTGFDSVFDIE